MFIEYAFTSFKVIEWETKNIYGDGINVVRINHSMDLKYEVRSSQKQTDLRLLALTLILKATNYENTVDILSYKATTEYLTHINKQEDKADPVPFLIKSAYQRAKDKYQELVISSDFSQLEFPAMANIEQHSQDVTNALLQSFGLSQK